MSLVSDASFCQWVQELAVFDAPDVMEAVRALITDPKTSVDSDDAFYAAIRTICALRVTTFYASNTYCDNPFSRYPLERVHAMIALIFERAYTFAMHRRGDLSPLLTLFYMKWDSPRFATGLLSAYSNEMRANATFSPVAASLLKCARAMQRLAPCGISPADYFARNAPAVLDGARYRVRYLAPERAHARRAACKAFISSCEADYVAMSEMYGEYDLILSIPGMSLSTVTPRYMADVSELTKQLLGPACASSVELELSLSSSDQIYLSASLDEYSAARAKDEFARRIRQVSASIRAAGVSAWLLPYCHGMPRAGNFFTQGALFISPANLEHSAQLHEVLLDCCQRRHQLVPFERGEKPFISAAAQIHSREVHARLDQDVIGSLVCGGLEVPASGAENSMSVSALSSISK